MHACGRSLPPTVVALGPWILLPLCHFDFFFSCRAWSRLRGEAWDVMLGYIHCRGNTATWFFSSQSPLHRLRVAAMNAFLPSLEGRGLFYMHMCSQFLREDGPGKCPRPSRSISPVSCTWLRLPIASTDAYQTSTGIHGSLIRSCSRRQQRAQFPQPQR